MRKLLVEWSLLVLTICLLRIVAPSLMLGFAGVDFNFAVFGSIISLLAIILTGKAWEHIDFRALFRIAALLSFSLLVVCLYSPTFGSLRQTYISILDIFIVLETTLIFSLASLQKKEEALPVFTAVALSAQLLRNRWRDVSFRNIHRPRYS